MKKRKWLYWTMIGIVVPIILILAAFIKVDKIFPREENTVQIFVDDTMNAPLFRFRIDNGRYPTSEEGLAALIEAPSVLKSSWKGPYLEQIPPDPWLGEYQYRSPGIHNPKKFDLWSMGPDGVNSEDDIGNW